jgi:hypothetical protein
LLQLQLLVPAEHIVHACLSCPACWQCIKLAMHKICLTKQFGVVVLNVLHSIPCRLVYTHVYT